MRGFEYHQPTQVVFGPGAARRAGDLAASLGGGALVVCGSNSARVSGALDTVIKAIEHARVPYDLLEGVPPNPASSLVDAGAGLMRARGLDVVVAVGGGSVLDVGKAVAVSALTGQPYRTFLSGLQGRQAIAGSLPTIAVPTLPGSGSETNGTSVIVDDVSGRKLSAHSELAAPRVALIDPAWAASAPADLLGTACADALCHAIESRLSDRASLASDTLADGAARLLLAHAPAAVEGDLDAVAHCCWASNLAGQALSLAGSIVTHPLSHPLSARCGAPHGAAVAALEPAVLAHLADRWDHRLVAVGRWFNTRARSPEGALRTVLTKLAAWNRIVGVTATAEELGLEPGLVEQLVDDVVASGSRGLANTPGPQPDRDLLRDLYAAAMSTAPAVPVRAG